MRISKLAKRGFTLVELMIVVAIIGVLAALAIFGVRKYLLNAKTSEAKNTIGAITRTAVAAYEREKFDSQLITAGGTSSSASHALCNGATKVPNGAVPAGKKYTANPAEGQDYNTGNTIGGWKCLKFSLNEPAYFQYQYVGGATPGASIIGGNTAPDGLPTAGAGAWRSEAAGDLNGDGVTSYFASYGAVVNGQPITSTTLGEANPEE